MRAHFAHLLPAGLTALLSTLWFHILAPDVPSNGDLLLAMPMAKAKAFPGMYPETDLLVQTGLKGPFHLYHMAGVLFREGLDVNHVWEVAHMATTFVTLMGCWLIGMAITRSRAMTALAVLALATAPVLRGTLHNTSFPEPCFRSSAPGIAFAVLGVGLLFQGWPVAAAGLAAVAFYAHPGHGLIAAGVITAVMLLGQTRPLQQRVNTLCVLALGIGPQMALILKASPENFVGSASQWTEYFALWGGHAHFTEHWPWGYGFFLVGLALSSRFFRTGTLQRDLGVAGLALTGVMVLYLMVVHLFPIKTVIVLYLMRASVLCKAIMFPLLVMGFSRSITTAPNDVRRAIALGGAGAMTLAMLTPNPVTADGAALLALACVWSVWRPWAAGLALFLGVVATPVADVQGLGGPGHAVLVVLAGLSALAFALDSLSHKPAEVYEPLSHRALALWGVLVLGLSVGLNYPKLQSGHSQVNWLGTMRPEIEGVVTWARDSSPEQSTFVVPPTDMAWISFRLNAERGIWMHLSDLATLSYSAGDWGEGFRRLAQLKIKIPARKQVVDEGYARLNHRQVTDLGNEGVDYIVFDRRYTGDWPGYTVYQDGWYTVVDAREVKKGAWR